MNRPKDKNMKRRWYDRRENDEWAKHVAADPWRQHVVDQLDGLRSMLVICGSILVVTLAGLGIWQALTSSEVSSNQNANTMALCTFRDDLNKRVTQGNDFLKTHPNGLDGITAGVIRVSIQGEKTTLSALKGLHC